MAIVGIGIDSVLVERIAFILKRPDGEVFKKRVFSHHEVDYCEKFKHFAEHYAARFAAKEAFIKASGVTSLSLNEIEVRNQDSGAPFFILSPSIEKKLKTGNSLVIHLSLTHTSHSAQAFVVLENV